MEKLHAIRLKQQSSAPVLAGHPWVFSNAIISDTSQINEVCLVEIFSQDNAFLGIGMFNPKTSIKVRIISKDKNTVIDKEFFEKRFFELDKRKKEFLPSITTGYRLCNADSDMFPGLIIDRYEDTFVFQIHTAGMDIFRDDIVSAIKEAFNPSAIVERSDIEARKQEGLLDMPVGVKFGDVAERVKFKEGGITFFADVLKGQKTGFFLDQRDARRKTGELSKNKNVMNLFSYSGGFGLYSALNGASSVSNIDISEQALKIAKENFSENGLNVNDEKKWQFICADVFDYLANVQTGACDLIICDPPAFAKSNDKIEQAKKAYTDINRKCLKILNKGGILITSSCSGRLCLEDFRNVLKIASGKAEKDVRVLDVITAPFDHTERLCFPEGRYLKTFVLEVI